MTTGRLVHFKIKNTGDQPFYFQKINYASEPFILFRMKTKSNTSLVLIAAVVLASLSVTVQAGRTLEKYKYHCTGYETVSGTTTQAAG